MGAFTFSNEYISTISPARLFKALTLDTHNLVPKLMPQAIKAMEGLEILGRSTSLKFISIKNRTDELNEEKFMYKHFIIDLNEKFESIVLQAKFEPTPKGGSKNKVRDTYYTTGNVELKEEEVKVSKRDSWKYTSSAKHTSFKILMLMLEPSEALLNKFKKSRQ